MSNYFRLSSVIALVFYVFASANAQVSLHIQGGINNSSINPIDFNDISWSTSDQFGWFAGLGASLPLNQRFSVNLDANYSIKGYRINNRISATKNNFLDQQFNNIEVIPSVSYRVVKPIKVTLGIFGNYRLNGKLRSSMLDEWFKLETPNKINDVGIQSGVAYQVKRFTVFLNGQLGVIKNKSAIELTNETGSKVGFNDYYTRNIQLGLAIQLID